MFSITELQQEADKERAEAENEEVVIPKKVDMYTLRQASSISLTEYISYRKSV